MGIKSIAIYSKEDKDALHVKLADQRVCVGEGSVHNSYLNMDHIIQAALNMGADAIHPGFGFLSENSKFARKCEEYQIHFIGPSAELIDCMGNKSSARSTMMKAGGAVVLGTKEPVYEGEEAKIIAQEIGAPIMIKESSGVGGKSMRVALNEYDIENAFDIG